MRGRNEAGLMIRLYSIISAKISGMLAYSKRMQRTINQFRMDKGVRVLWPDYEVYDLLNERINLEDLRFFTSNSIQIIKIKKQAEKLQEVFADKSFTHLSIHTTCEFDEDTELNHIYFAILSKRGIAIDQLNCRFVRGSYLITVAVAQLNKQANFWGIESVSDSIKIIDTKYIVKKKSMWVLEFQSTKSIKSLLFYSTKREPHYGKSSSYDNELPKDAKLEFCMNVRNFSSVMDNLMEKNEQRLIEDIHFLKKSHNNSFKFNEENIKKESLIASEAERKVEQNSFKKRLSTNQKTLPNQNAIKVKFFPNATCQQIIEVRQLIERTPLNNQIQSFIDKSQQHLHQLAKSHSQWAQNTRDVLMNIRFTQMKQCSWKELTDLMQVAREDNQSQLHQYILSVLIFIFGEQNDKDIRNWMQLKQYSNQLQSEHKDLFLQWLKRLLDLHCRQMFSECQDNIFEMFPQSELKAMITKSLEIYSDDSPKICDLLEILMRITSKNDILELYENHRLPDCPLIITKSLRTWQAQHNLYGKQNAILLYETKEEIPYVQYSPLNPTQTQSQSVDFSFTFSCSKVSKNAFLTGQCFTFNNNTFRYFLHRNSDTVLLFLEEIVPIASEVHIQKFTSFEISIQLNFGSQAQRCNFGWSFISPSPAVGRRLIFKQLDDVTSLQCKIQLKRRIIHDSILNYLHVRFGELMNLPNKSSDKLQCQNKKILKRRSSVKLQKNLLKMPLNEGLGPFCFLHVVCQKCQGLWFPFTQLSSLDLYSLLYAAPLKEELDAFFPTFKYIIMMPSQNNNLMFWVSQIRAKHLHLTPLLKVINSHHFGKETLEILNSLIDKVIKESLSLESRSEKICRFLKSGQSRTGKGMWSKLESDYSQEYHLFLKNVRGKL